MDCAGAGGGALRLPPLGERCRQDAVNAISLTAAVLPRLHCR